MTHPPVQRHKYVGVNKIPDDSVPSPFHGVTREPTSVQIHQRAPHDQPQKIQKTGNRPTATSWQSGRQPTTINGAHRRRYLCTICGKGYAQRQGVTRHQREVHKTNSCRHCRAFQWGRPYLLREHLERRHPDIDPDTELEEVNRNSRKTTISTTHLPREWVLPPALEHSRQVSVESQLRPPTLSLPPVKNFPPVSPNAFQDVDDCLQPNLAEPAIMKNNHEGAQQLEALNSTEKASQIGKDLDDFTHMQIWLALPSSLQHRWFLMSPIFSGIKTADVDALRPIPSPIRYIHPSQRPQRPPVGLVAPRSMRPRWLIHLYPHIFMVHCSPRMRSGRRTSLSPSQVEDPVRTSTSTGTCSKFVVNIIAVADYGTQGLASLRLDLWFTTSFRSFSDKCLKYFPSFYPLVYPLLFNDTTPCNHIVSYLLGFRTSSISTAVINDRPPTLLYGILT